MKDTNREEAINNIKIGDLVYDEVLDNWVYIREIVEAKDNIDTGEKCFNGDWNDSSRIRTEWITHIIPKEEIDKYKIGE